MTETPAAVGHNFDQILVNAVLEIERHEAVKKEASDRIKEIIQVRIKGDLGMEPREFKHILKTLRLGPDERASFFYNLDRMAKALRIPQNAAVGETVDWVEAVERHDREHEPSPSAKMVYASTVLSGDSGSGI